MHPLLRDPNKPGAAANTAPNQPWPQEPWHQVHKERFFVEPAVLSPPGQRHLVGGFGGGGGPWRLPISGVLLGMLGVMLVGGPWLSGLLEMGQVPSTAHLNASAAALQKPASVATGTKSLTAGTATPASFPSAHATTEASQALSTVSIEELPPPAAGPKPPTPSRPSYSLGTGTQMQRPTGTAIKLASQAPWPPRAAIEVTGQPSPAASPPAPSPALSSASIEKKLTPMTPAQHAQISYAQAVASTQAGRSMLALTQAQDALRHQPTHHEARHLAAVLLHETARTEPAVELLREGLRLEPQNAALALLLAQLQAHQGALDTALQTLDQNQLHTLEGETLRAGLWSQLRNHPQAASAYEAALKMQPGQATLWLGLGVALEGQGQRGPAQQAFARAQALGLGGAELTAFVAQRLKALE